MRKEYELRAGDKIKVRIYGTDGKAIKTRNFDEVFTVYEKNGKLGIDWADEFTPFTNFSLSNTDFIIVECALDELINYLVKNEDMASVEEFHKVLKEDREFLIRDLQWRAAGGHHVGEVVPAEYAKACKELLELI